MTSQSSFIKEMRAFAALGDLMEKAEQVGRLFDAAGLDRPAPLARMLNGADSDGDGRGKLTVPPLDREPRPDEAKSDWIWVPIEEVATTAVIQGVLRANKNTPMPPKEIWERVKEYHPTTLQGTVYNVGPREEGRVIERIDGNWRLIDSSKAPVLLEGAAWGPPDIFTKYELATHRRLCILHILNSMSDGLMAMQIVKSLQASDFCRAPASKDLVKGDLEWLLREKRVRRIGNTRKYTTVSN